MKVKVSELSGAALDWAVAVAEGERPIYTRQWVIPSHPEDPRRVCVVAFNGHLQPYEPSQWWGIGGPIIEREELYLCNYTSRCVSKVAELWLATKGVNYFRMAGSTPLIAAMRCYVASKLGEEVEIPKELV